MGATMKQLSTILFITAIGFLIGFFVCYKMLRKEPTVITTEILITDTLPVPFNVYVPTYIQLPGTTDTVIVTMFDSIKVTEIDTVYIIKDYYTARQYKDTLYNERDALIYLEETAYQNQIRDRSLLFINHSISRNFWAVGGEIGLREISAGVLHKRNQNIYKFSINKYQPGINFTFGYYKLLN